MQTLKRSIWKRNKNNTTVSYNLAL